LEHSQSVQYFAHKFPFTTHQVLNSAVSYAKNKFDKQTSLNVRHLRLYLSKYLSKSFKHLSIKTRWSDLTRE